MHNRDCFRKPFGSERLNESEKLRKSAKTWFSPTFSSFWAKLSLKKLSLIRSKILGLLLNTLTAHYEYYRSNRENLPFQIEINWSKNLQYFLMYFFLIFGIYIKLAMFWNKHERHTSNISNVIDSGKCPNFNS